MPTAGKSRPTYSDHVEFLNGVFRRAFKRGAFTKDGPEIVHNVVVSFTALFDLAQNVDAQTAEAMQQAMMARQKMQPQPQPQQTAKQPCAGCDDQKNGGQENEHGKQR